MALHTRAPTRMECVVEVHVLDFDLFVAALAAIVRHGREGVAGERRVTPHVGDDLPERDELVKETLDLPGVDMALDAGDVLVRALSPRIVIGGHLVA